MLDQLLLVKLHAQDLELGLKANLEAIILSLTLTKSNKKSTQMAQSKQDLTYTLILCLTEVVFTFILPDHLKEDMLSKSLVGEVKVVLTTGLLLTLGTLLGEKMDISELR